MRAIPLPAPTSTTQALTTRALTRGLTTLALTTLALTVSFALPVLAQTYSPPVGALTPQGIPSGTNAGSSARPGNDVGTGMSLPMGHRASNIDSQDTHSQIAPNLPGPGLGENASAADYLRAAQAALSAGRTGEVQQSLEMAQTRMLDRSVAYGQTNSPSDNPGVGRISQALRALAAGDRASCMASIQSALTVVR